MKIYIAGAHSRASTMGYYLQYLDPTIEILAYLYDNDEINPKSIKGVPVRHIDENSELDTDCQVYLAMRGVNHLHMKETLMKCGMKNIVPVDVELDLSIRNQYLKKYYDSIGREFIKIDDSKFSNNDLDNGYFKARLYVASSAFDKSLQKLYNLTDYEKLIQVGTDLSTKRLDTDCFDNIGENISIRNLQFCELTAMYWIWKNAREDVVGLEHYRRKFILPNDWIERMDDNGIDVILPIPLYVHPSLEENYKFRHSEEVWNCMLEYVRENMPYEYNDIELFFKNTGLYSPCNMIIAKKEVFDTMCEWLFPILFAIVDVVGEFDDKYQNRYPGFLSERLITYYFEKHTEINKVYADKEFLS